MKARVSCDDRLMIQRGEIHVGSSSRNGRSQSHAYGSKTLGSK
jgi:hypothetical protein